ncbi:MAG TPA: GGDEF domain-containing protein [Bradyrhizobium sp.]|nr:GGDEF domain-containing protein [Bradyrhizobium sp.]
MSQQGPILFVSITEAPPLANALGVAGIFPVLDIRWADASRAIAQIQPAAILAEVSGASRQGLDSFAKQAAAASPYLPLIAIDPKVGLPENAIPFSQGSGQPERLIARLNAALRVRTLHATVLRRAGGAVATAESDPVRDATVLLIGRGASYPALSVALGERMSVVGALSIEAAAKHLNDRDFDGIVLGEGFTLRVMDAFLRVLSEDSRFRNLPVILTSDALAPSYDLPNLEIIASEPLRVAANALPLIRQHAFEAYLGRTLRSIEKGGLLDPQTGLLTRAAFSRDLAAAVEQTLSHGGGLSIARFAFDPPRGRAQRDGGRIISRLMRKMDFGAVHEDGSIVVVLTETDLRTAHSIARRLSSVMRHTSHGTGKPQSAPVVTVATMQPSDSVRSLLARLHEDGQRQAS